MPGLGEKVELFPYDNHILVAAFLNYNHIIDTTITDTIDKISQHINVFYFSRYDLRCASIEDLKMGRNFSIPEVNAAVAEPEPAQSISG